MFIIEAVKGKKLILGRLGENQARAVRFNTAEIQAEFPGAEYSLLNTRPSDPDAYPVNGQFISIDGTGLLWVLQSGDLAVEGFGECELKATLNGAIVKDEIYQTEILRALDGNGEPPEPWESWQEQVEADADRAEAAAELLEHPGAVAETLTAGSEATARYEDGTFYFGIPRGQKGSKGDPGQQGPAGPEGPEGPQGPDGVTPNVTAGTTTTLAPGSDATVTRRSGSPDSAPVFDFGIPKGDPGEVSEAELQQTRTELMSAIQQKAPLIFDTVQNVAIASVSDAIAHPVTALKIGIEPVQSGSGDPSPSNIRPITGWDAVHLMQSGEDTSDPNTHTASLPSTVFGGVIDWMGAECANKLIMYVFDGDENWVAASLGESNQRFNCVQSESIKTSGFISNYLKPVTSNTNPFGGLRIVSGNTVMVTDSEHEFATLADFKAYLAEHPLQVLAELATPTEITLSDLDEISTIAGENNFFADSGDIVELTYGCDTKGYIDKKFTELQALILENS